MILVTENGVQQQGPGRTLYDYASATVTYIGRAKCGSRKADRAWLIERITFNAGGNPIETVTAEFGQPCVWDDRATLGYSDD